MRYHIGCVQQFMKEVRGVDASVIQEAGPAPLKGDLKIDRIKFMLEELDEFTNAETLEDQVDALVDLQYFLYGTLLEMGVNADQFTVCFNRVHKANMAKKAGRKEGRFTTSVDATKPEGWVEPDLKSVFQAK